MRSRSRWKALRVGAAGSAKRRPRVCAGLQARADRLPEMPEVSTAATTDKPPAPGSAPGCRAQTAVPAETGWRSTAGLGVRSTTAARGRQRSCPHPYRPPPQARSAPPGPRPRRAPCESAPGAAADLRGWSQPRVHRRQKQPRPRPQNRSNDASRWHRQPDGGQGATGHHTPRPASRMNQAHLVIVSASVGISGYHPKRLDTDCVALIVDPHVQRLPHPRVHRHPPG